MTVYKPIKVLASRAAEAAVRLAKGQPVIARSGIDNGKGEVPSLLLEIVAVTRDNLRETIVADGFRVEADVYGK
jgi:D-xylose transport system substrate-binding protein